MTPTPTSAARRLLRARPAALLGTLALAALLAGCSGGATATGVSTPASTSTATANAAGSRTGFAAYAACLSQHGITLPSGRPSNRPSGQFTGPPAPRPSGGFRFAPPSGVSSSAFAAAQQACAALRPAGRFGAGGLSALAAFRSCMSDHGVTLPSTGPVFGALSTTDPKVASALSICRPLLPSRPGAPSPTTTTSP